MLFSLEYDRTAVRRKIPSPQHLLSFTHSNAITLKYAKLKGTISSSLSPFTTLCMENGLFLLLPKKKINTYELTCTFDHNANKSWHVFDISDGGKLTISGGINGNGTMVVNFKDVKSPVYLFSIGSGGTLVLEADLTFEIHYPANDKDNIFGFEINGEYQSFAKYDGIYVDRSTDGIIKIVVGVTTTITEAGVTQN